jgi:hypothetical protein
VLLFVFVLGGARCWIAAQPERFYEAVAFFILRQPNEGRALLWGDDPADVLIQPPLVFAG